MNDNVKLKIFNLMFDYFKKHRFFIVSSIFIIAILIIPIDCNTKYGNFKKGGLKYFETGD